MKKVTDRFLLGLLAGLFFSALVLIFCVFAWQWIYPLPYQLPAAGAQPASTPATLGELTTRIEALESDQAYNLKVFEWKLDQKILSLGFMALFISAVAGFVGFKTYNDLEKIIKERVNASLEKALYQLDPTNLPIHIYKGRIRRSENPQDPPVKIRSEARNSLVKVAERLEMTGLLNKGFVSYLDKTSETGITVVPIDDEEDENEFIRFVNQYHTTLKKEEAGFILYAPPGYPIKTAMNIFPNTTIANMPATVASMILVVGRGLKNRES
jgi:hypothetical protein